jgi:hypothetical protein
MRSTRQRVLSVGLGALAVLGAVGLARYAGLLDGLLGTGPSGERALASSTLGTYCVDCHDPVLQSGGLVLEADALADIGAHAEIWEKVVHKLRAGTMPPLDEPRPEAEAYDRIAGYLETSLDAAAAANPDPGRLPQLHRLTRTEYANSIRDLVGLSQLPIEMNYELLLPADNASSGFDNIADLLFVSPVVMERYLEAARKIARLAVGDPAMPVMVNIHRLPLELPQDEDFVGLPFGTRGGLVAETYFPLDAEYVFHVELERPAREPHEIEITIDGTRAAATEVGRGAAGRGPLEFRVPVGAGPHTIGATFVRRTQALDESTVRVQRRGRGTLPAIELVTISGPYDASGPGDTPSRARIFVCTPAQGASEGVEVDCARTILGNLVRRGYRRPATPADVDELMAFFDAGRAAGGSFDAGIQRALERLLVSPQFLYRIERVPEGVGPGETFEIAPLELASRLSFFLWSSLPDDTLLALAESGALGDDAVLDAEIERMLADPRSVALVDNFASQWLFLRDVEAKDPDLFLFRDTTRACARPSSRRRSCSSTASCAGTAACSS